MGSLPNLSVIKGALYPVDATSLHNVIERVAVKYPDRTAVIFEDKEIIKYTYSKLNKVSNQLAREILRNISTNNLCRNSDGDYVIAVCMLPTDKLIVTLFAIWKAGCAYLPLDPSLPEERIRHIVNESQPILLIYEKDSKLFGSTNKSSYDDLFNQSTIHTSECLQAEDCLVPSSDNLAIVLYTSGSTGVPKGVRLPHKVIWNRLQWQFRTFPYSETEEVGIFKTALTFVDSVSEIWGPLMNGRAILVTPKSVTTNPEKLIAALEKYKIERLVLVPSLLRSLLMYLEMEKCDAALPSLKTWICSGEILTTSLAKQFYEYFPENEHKLLNFYGSTEIMGDVTYHILRGLDELKDTDKVPIGLPIDNTIIYILDSEFLSVKAGEVGELFVAGSNLAAGYVNKRDKEKFIENPLTVDPTFNTLYRTGDFAKYEKGLIFYEGRIDSQVKVRGHRVDLAEIERCIRSIEGVDKVIVLCYKPGEMDQSIVAFVTANDGLTKEEIDCILDNKLPVYMTPRVVIKDNIPLLINGKIDRQTLLQSFENLSISDDTSQPNFDLYKVIPDYKLDSAKDLLETVGSVLSKSGRSVISLEDNFYTLGGTSLNTLVAVGELRERGYQISVTDFIASKTLGDILTLMTEEITMATLCESAPFEVELLSNEHKSDVISMVASSFYYKADLEQWLMPDINLKDYEELVNALWNSLVAKRTSFIVFNKSYEACGVSLNFDIRDEPSVNISSKLTVVFDFLESIEGPLRDTVLPKDLGTVLHSFMMATNSTLSPKENVTVMNFMEDQVVQLASRRNFVGIFTTNTSPLTQQLGSAMYNYQVLLDYQVNQYVAPNGTKPFGLAPDSQRAIVHWKPL